MAELSENDVRQIPTIFNAVNEIKNAVQETRNMVRDIRGYTLTLMQANPHQHLAAISDMRATITTIRNDTMRVNDLVSAMTATHNSVGTLQHAIGRIESVTAGTAATSTHIERLKTEVTELKAVLANMEQFLGDLSAYVQSVHTQLANLTADLQ